jgi:hypothetical protein|tara:strand:+ start:914 stop:1180 length:267 start_codon:yes stop_codon:yes gene_type:complete
MSKLTYRVMMDYAEQYALEESRHLGAVMTMADRAFCKWRKAHKHPRLWQEALVRDWWADEKLWKLTRKSDYKRDRGNNGRANDSNKGA